MSYAPVNILNDDVHISKQDFRFNVRFINHYEKICMPSYKIMNYSKIININAQDISMSFSTNIDGTKTLMIICLVA